MMATHCSPPPTYEEATRDDPVRNLPSYCEREEFTNAAQQQQTTRQNIVLSQTSNFRVLHSTNRVSPNVLTVQPQSNTRSGDSGHCLRHTRSKNICSFNCFCFACDCIRPCFPRHCFCFNCIVFIFYTFVCLPGVCICWVVKRICPETFGECFQRNWDLMESYESRQENFCSHCLWSCLGPFCCYSCKSETEVCPWSECCFTKFGCVAIKKMVCFCAHESGNICDCRIEVFDESLFGYLCDIKECGCIWNHDP